MREVSFIIVNYNVTDFLRNCLQSIVRFANDVDYEIVVVDNNSPDKSWLVLEKEFPFVKFISSPQNLGFSKANNLAAENASGEYFYLLNPDTELEGAYLRELLNFAGQTERFGCLGLRMHDKEGNFLPESKRTIPSIASSFEKLFNVFRSNHSKSYYLNKIGEFEIAEAEVLTGANLLIKRSVYQEIGGLDEAYFMYGEDIDLCYTLLRNGYRNWYFGKYSILHHKGESTVKDHIYLNRFYGAMKIFVRKYYPNPLMRALLFAGLALRQKLEYFNLPKTKTTQNN